MSVLVNATWRKLRTNNTEKLAFMLPEKHKIFIDFCIGDGYITDTKKGYSLQIQHSAKQREYLLHKVTILQEYGFNPSFTEEYRENSYGKHFVKSVCYTAHAKTAHKYLYNRKIKTIDAALLQVLDRKSLAYWYMDDGCVDHYNKMRTGDVLYTYETPFARSYRFATHSFTIDENRLIQEWLHERFNIAANINYQKGLPFISISQIPSKDAFKHLIEDYIIDTMRYKIQYPHSLKGIPYEKRNTVRD